MSDQGGIGAMFNFVRGKKDEAEVGAGSSDPVEVKEEETLKTKENEAGSEKVEAEVTTEVGAAEVELDPTQALLLKIGGLEEQINSLREPVKEEAPVQETLPEIEVGSFITDEFKEVLGDVFSEEQLQALDKWGGLIYKTARVDSLRDVPALMERSFNRKTNEQTAIADFWTANSDIAELSQNEQALGVMKSVVMRIQSENPNLSTRAALDKMGEEVRGAFALESKAKEVVKEASKGRKSNFAKPPRKGRSSAPTEEPNEQQQQIAEMFDHVEAGG